MQMKTERKLVAVLVALTLAVAGAGCGGGSESSQQLSPGAAATTPAPPPDPCLDQPPGLAQDGVNDAQGGSSPGVDPCDGPGN